MLSHIRDIQRSRPSGMPLPGLRFRRWYGHPLTLAQEAILTILEKQRMVDGVAPCVMIDDPVGDEGIRRFLEAYTVWFATEAWPVSLPASIVSTQPTDRRRSAVRRLSHRCGQSLRGVSSFATLFLDVDRWCPWRRPCDLFADNLLAIQARFTRTNPRNLLIIHGNIRPRARSRCRVNTFRQRFLRLLDSPEVCPTLSLDTLLTSLRPYRQPRRRPHHRIPVIIACAPPPVAPARPGEIPPLIRLTKFPGEAAAAPAA